MKIAYLVIAYTDPCQIQRLVSSLSMSGDIYLHINKKVDITPFEKALENKDERLYWASKRFRVNWGGYSILQATFQIMGDALKNNNYDRFVLLTGQDYPIKSPEFIIDFFRKNQGIDFVYGDICDTVKKMSLQEIYFYDKGVIKNKILAVLKKIFPHRFFLLLPDGILYKGKHFPYRGLGPKWSLCGTSARKVYDFFYKNSKLNRQFKYMHAPDDIYLPSIYPILFNDDSLSSKKIFYHLTNIGVLNEEEYEELMASNSLFARKFDSCVSAKLLSRLDSSFIGKERV